MVRFWGVFFSVLFILTSSSGFAGALKIKKNRSLIFVRVEAHDKFERSKISNLGISIEVVVSDSVYAYVTDKELSRIKRSGLKIIEKFRIKDRVVDFDFPPNDARFHNYQRMTKALDEIVSAHPNIMRKFSIGKSLEGREIWCVQINSSSSALHAGRWGRHFGGKPGVVFMGNHHAREHVSAEIPLMLLEFLAKNYGVDRDITALVDKRDTFIIPMVNPDGVEFDIASGVYQWQRKNTRQNNTQKPGVDLNRNYGYMWNHGGSSSDPESEVYMGPEPFSEPETQAIRRFVDSQPNIKVLLSYHTFSELILYPWGHKHAPIENPDDLKTFKAMADRMATWNGYTPEQSSDLYIASGDTTDWAYGTRRIFAFTFELSPKDMWGGGFYPGAGILDHVFQDNLKPALYLMEMAENPHRALQSQRDERLSWLQNSMM